MISKKEALEIFKNAKFAEEKAIPIYTKHLSSALFWTGMGREKIQKIKEALDTLAKESKVHIELTEFLINFIKNEEKDAF
jgi:rubrerythrin